LKSAHGVALGYGVKTHCPVAGLHVSAVQANPSEQLTGWWAHPSTQESEVHGLPSSQPSGTPLQKPD
jgi:hypothetical protein